MEKNPKEGLLTALCLLCSGNWIINKIPHLPNNNSVCNLENNPTKRTLLELCFLLDQCNKTWKRLAQVVWQLERQSVQNSEIHKSSVS